MGPITQLKGVGPRVAERLQKIGISSIQDLLFHLPLRYEDRTRITPIGAALSGTQVVVKGEIELTQLKYGRRRSLLCRISDGSGSMTLRFFHFSMAQQKQLHKGQQLVCYGEVRNGPMTQEMVHPEYKIIMQDAEPQMEEQLTPVYPTTEGLHQISLRKLTGQALTLLNSKREKGLPDYLEILNGEIPDEFGFTGENSIIDVINYVHRPPVDASVDLLQEGLHPAQQRLAFEELLAHQLSLRISRREFKSQQAAAMGPKGELQKALLAQLAFKPTTAQQRVISEILADLARPEPMSRLVQGDVGSGKTLVAVMAALQALESGYQVAFMAPTELLAEQHLQTFRQWLEPLDITVLCLSSQLKAEHRRSMLQQIARLTKSVVIGTHALFQNEVVFRKLGLSIVDEQHRFGVHQRLALREKGEQNGLTPHQLIMTATPIPRTLAMTAYADLDVSIIDELPPGRQKVTTVAIPDNRRDEIIQRIENACQEGRQVYWVCTLIEESESIQCQAATDTAANLTKTLGNIRVGLIHGRLSKEEKNEVMEAFHKGEIELLVSTTVIEVGVDVPNASLMVIENAERLGLAQLHQLRGRVGRGSRKSDCVLMYHPPLSDNSKARLAIMRETNDGFKVSQKDLELRGPGEFLGTRQAGLMRLRIADLMRDKELLSGVEETAKLILAQHEEIIEPLIRRWLVNGLDYADV